MPGSVHAFEGVRLPELAAYLRRVVPATYSPPAPGHPSFPSRIDSALFWRRLAVLDFARFDIEHALGPLV